MVAFWLRTLVRELSSVALGHAAERLSVMRRGVCPMTVSESDRVDIVAQRDAEVRLVIADHLDWTDELEHFRLLQEKLNTYIKFFESGQLYQSHPESCGKSAAIHIAFRYPPTAHAHEHLLGPAATVVESAGLSLSWEVESAA